MNAAETTDSEVCADDPSGAVYLHPNGSGSRGLIGGVICDVIPDVVIRTRRCRHWHCRRQNSENREAARRGLLTPPGTRAKH